MKIMDALAAAANDSAIDGGWLDTSALCERAGLSLGTMNPDLFRLKGRGEIEVRRVPAEGGARFYRRLTPAGLARRDQLAAELAAPRPGLLRRLFA